MGPTRNDFDSLASTNERLIGEMNQFLASIAHSPGEESNCSNETRRTDNCSSSSDDTKSSSEKLTIPSISAASSDNGDEIKKKARSCNKNLIPIDEVNPSGQYEYYNNVSCDTSQSFDDDSLVAMAKRMDDASIISDFTAPSETFLALMPQPKKITAGMKKLGQKLNHSRKPAPPPRKTAGPGGKHPPPPRPPPRSPQQLNGNQLINPHNVGLSAYSTPRPSEMDMTAIIPKLKHDHPPYSSGSRSSSKENIEFRPDIYSKLNGKDYGRLPSSDTANSSERENDAVVTPDEQLGPATRAIKASTQKVGRNSSSPNDISTNEVRRGSVKKNRNRSSSSNMAPTAKSRGGGHGEMPTEPMPTSATSSAEGNTTTDHKVTTTKSKGNSISRREKRGRKKRQQKRLDSDSDEESMRGIGFNTRIHGSPKNIDNKPKRTAEQMPTHPHVRSTKTSQNPPQTTKTESRMDQFESSESDVYSAYDSDEQTQIFYESTDDDFESDEEPVAVGTSVADAVKDLNNKRAVTKVKNLFGIRG
mmetsp:Transcript_36981/g.66537  ORF Transcript_36981/g.66537 Transcript_36981/m.66537 type:complete len:531 (+) Transcript_36981:284-1876(+)|eukprot:CAMPEP_0201885696 /NCGR_PEP_ID=MMETSP0902-20130614/19787_1 /ASSEMBLY_ACC=CAM_ASM_000551 /TAXON_ID=420261 /ORGANISM="Thalassiosira antarctica, Strain CCMP982" /LENGTH=530 /DNA_ID=CAMNT_0048415007 /DNA_START=196 /DNA_END=1788 /DNA_ORIENTATION=-